MRAQGQKTSEGAASAVCTRNNLCQHESNREETNKIREFEERLGAICGLETSYDLEEAAKVMNLDAIKRFQAA